MWTIGVLYLVAVCAQLVLNLDRGFVSVSTTYPGLWWAQLATLGLLALAVAFSLLRSRAIRRSVTGLVIDLHIEAAAGGMREALAAWLHDPSLQVAYAVDGTYRDVDLEKVDVTARRDDAPVGSSMTGTRSPSSCTVRGCSTTRTQYVRSSLQPGWG